jgi:PHD/YefM family antitoxin component YafN of YafNO toxin-antitoxin module
MKTVNALSVRNKLGEILDTLTETGEPILVSKGRQIRAVLITPDDFQRRFIDVQAAEAKERLLESIRNARGEKTVQKGSLEVLRELRGYER